MIAREDQDCHNCALKDEGSVACMNCEDDEQGLPTGWRETTVKQLIDESRRVMELAESIVYE